MTEAYVTPDFVQKRDVPEFDLADRLRKALRHGDVGVQEMADYLEVDRGTVSNWINGRIKPSAQSIFLFAMRCGVNRDWLKFGTTDVEPLIDVEIERQRAAKAPATYGLKVRSSTVELEARSPIIADLATARSRRRGVERRRRPRRGPVVIPFRRKHDLAPREGREILVSSAS